MGSSKVPRSRPRPCPEPRRPGANPGKPANYRAHPVPQLSTPSARQRCRRALCGSPGGRAPSASLRALTGADSPVGKKVQPLPAPAGRAIGGLSGSSRPAQGPRDLGAAETWLLLSLTHLPPPPPPPDSEETSGRGCGLNHRVTELEIQLLVLQKRKLRPRQRAERQLWRAVVKCKGWVARERNRSSPPGNQQLEDHRRGL